MTDIGVMNSSPISSSEICRFDAGTADMNRIKRKQDVVSLNRRGLVLVVSLVLIVIMVLMVGIAVQNSTDDLKIAGNQKTGVKAFYAAEAGIAEALHRLRGPSTAAYYTGDPSSTPDAMWSAYILTADSWQSGNDVEYSADYRNYFPTATSHTNTAIAANSLQSAIPYFVSIRHKTEYDAEQDGHDPSSPHYYDNDGFTGKHTASSRGNLVYWGYGNPAAAAKAAQFTSGTATVYKPVEIINCYGNDGTALRRIRVEAVRNPGPLVQAAIYAKGDITGNGGYPSQQIWGVDECGVVPDKPATYTLNTSANPSATLVDADSMFPDPPPSPNNGPIDIDVAGYVADMKGSAATTITSDVNGASYGNAANFTTVYSDTSAPYNVQGLKLNNVTGYGTLLVKGDLELGGGFNWNGLVLCSGTLTFNGGGAGINIRGAVLANQTVTINGGLITKYNSCMVEKALNSQALKIIRWKECY